MINTLKPSVLFLTLILVFSAAGWRQKMPLDPPGENFLKRTVGESILHRILPDDSVALVGNVNAIGVDKDNVKWFSTDAGLVSYDGESWEIYDWKSDLPVRDLKGLALTEDESTQEIWIASSGGVTVLDLPLNETSESRTFTSGNSAIFGDKVIAIAAGKGSIRWIGTEKGISAMFNEKFLQMDYDMYYPEELFFGWPITTMATNPGGDSLYVATAGAGIARVYHDEVDAISGASVYAHWGPIILPSDNIYSIYITPDGIQWFGTDSGVARHSGNNTLENWTVYTTENGLVNNFVQAICGDGRGNVWFGTKGGISVFDGQKFISYAEGDGLANENILSLATDLDGVVWIGTAEGISRFENGEFFNYR